MCKTPNSVIGVFSVRLVIADFYMEKPIFGVDPCYSEFRGKEIKRVPIIRVFGSNADGHKTCMHIHGVFPYFYIPYEAKEFESPHTAIYQIAINVDKAINISLGQASSGAQHVFKVQLVKGIPLYGYHHSEHQFLKIYMFNPRFVRRAANLLQSGAILGKNFNPYESHVPYILQFMIDYNLYGMSFVHVPLEIVKFRQSNDDKDAHRNDICDTEQMKSPAKRQSVSAIEVDIGSNFILNRFQLAVRSTTHSNPGIEAIWYDERLRRQKMTDAPQLTKLEMQVSQQRLDVQTTESEIFHRTILLSKLLSSEVSTTISSSQSTQQLCAVNAAGSVKDSQEEKHTFNLRKIIGNAVYPEECAPNEELTDASFIENHLSSNRTQHNGSFSTFGDNLCVGNVAAARGDSIFLDDTILDEELAMNLTATSQVPLNASLRAEDMELLDVLQQLEEDDDENQIDLDSTLAPLTQTHTKSEHSVELLDKRTVGAACSQVLPESDAESDTSENGKLNDFSIVLEDLDELILKFTPSQITQETNATTNLEQLDGSDDFLAKTPTKAGSRPRSECNTNAKTSPRTPKTPKRTSLSPKRSPRTPKSSTGKKYAPLPIKITCKKDEKNFEQKHETTPLRQSVSRNLDLGSSTTKSAKMPLSKRLALVALRRRSVDWSPSSIQEANLSDRNGSEGIASRIVRPPVRRSRRAVDLDRTHITCELTPRRKNGRVLKVYSIEGDGIRKPESERNMQGTEENQATDRITETVNMQTLSSAKSVHSQTQSPKEMRNRKRHAEIFQNDQDGSKVDQKNADKVQKCIESKYLMNKSGDNLVDSLPTLPERMAYSDGEARRDTLLQITSKQQQLKAANKCTIFESPPRISSSNEGEEIAASDTEDADKTFNTKRLRRNRHLERCLRVTKPDLTSPKYDRRQKANENNNESPTSPTNSNEEFDNSCDLHIQSFYESSFTEELSSPLNYNEILHPTPAKNSCCLFSAESSTSINCCQQQDVIVEQLKTTSKTSISPMIFGTPTSCLTNSGTTNLVQITPSNLPPSRDAVVASCWKLDIPEFEFQGPFYGNPEDITRHKEVGHIILQIPGNALNDCVEFKSVLGDRQNGLTEWRRKKLLEISGSSALTTPSEHNVQRIREFFAEPKQVTIVPIKYPPSRQEAKMWLKARELVSSSEDVAVASRRKVSLEDSPIKVTRQKVVMLLKDVADDDEDLLDNTSPLTQTMSVVSGEALQDIREEKENSTIELPKLAMNKLLTDGVSLKLTETLANGSLLRSHIDKSFLTANSGEHSTCSDISSQMVLDALKRNSFIKSVQSDGAPLPHELSFGLSCASFNNTFGFKVKLENLQQAKSDVECNYITIMMLELFVPTRGNLLPNPAIDEIRCIFYAIEHRSPPTPSEDGSSLPKSACGCIIVKDIERDGAAHSDRMLGTGGNDDVSMYFVTTEIEAFEALVKLTIHWDPDIYGGYEIEAASWGYILERAKKLDFSIAPLLSRIPSQKVHEHVDEDREHFTDLDIEMKLCGRILLDIWRLMRSEIALTSYTFQNVMYHILHRRCPTYSHRALTEWFDVPHTRWIVIEFYLERVRGTLALLEQLDVIGRTSEMAKLIGIQFYEVLSRGSQFRVESMMLRIAKPRNMVPLSPSVQQRAHMRAPEYLPLILEPQSRLYIDPVIVLDFQSLYPSMIIAYNYCFSTCLGRVEHIGQSSPFEFGASHLRVSPSLLRRLVDNDLVTISPCGVVFVKATVREGILPRMLSEILNTRQMVKESMKLHKSNSALQRILHSRQLGLKLMANVTYGYTAANFSGRMPAVEVGDSVVAKGRETLERAIKLVEANEKWRVRVVYGDTDSLFVHVPGRNRQQAFKIGEEIANAVSKENPQPVKLKLEKVYQPCILQTKKRYVGYMYETAVQEAPVYEAKGIETVRRDGCPAVVKLLEKVLRILFETADVSQVKKYVCRQFTKLLAGRANLQDLIFAKEFRGLNGYKPTACVPALELTRKWIKTDPRRVPRCGERVPFIIVNGPPGVPLIRLVRSPEEVLADEGLTINANYYITKAIIPPLNRCLLLIGADVNEWFASLPRKLLVAPPVSATNKLISSTATTHHPKRSTISQYFSVTNCMADCGRQTKRGICEVCKRNKQRTFVKLHEKMSKIERGYQLVQQICQVCCGRVGELKCCSLDCPVLYVSKVKERDLKQIEYLQNLLTERF